MTAQNTTSRTLLTVLLALVAIPVVMMSVVMPAMFMAGVGPMASALGSPWMLLMPVIPLTIFAGVGYVLYTELRRQDEPTMDQ